MPDIGKIALIVAVSVGAFSLLLLIISVGTTTWLDDGAGNTVGLFRQCVADNASATNTNLPPGCSNENRVTQGGLSIFGLLLLVFGIIVLIPNFFLGEKQVIFVMASLILFYFASMFVMAAYATWGQYSRDVNSYFFPMNQTDLRHTSMGSSYHLCVAAHYFLWTALTALAFGAGYVNGFRNTPTSS